MLTRQLADAMHAVLHATQQRHVGSAYSAANPRLFQKQHASANAEANQQARRLFVVRSKYHAQGDVVQKI
jgi:hypothetical protein